MFRRVSEVLFMRNLGIGIHLKHIDAASLRQPVVDPRITAQTENPVNPFREPLEFLFCVFLNHSRLRYKTDLLLVFNIPFDFACRDVCRAVGQIGHDQLPGGVCL